MDVYPLQVLLHLIQSLPSTSLTKYFQEVESCQADQNEGYDFYHVDPPTQAFVCDIQQTEI